MSKFQPKDGKVTAASIELRKIAATDLMNPSTKTCLARSNNSLFGYFSVSVAIVVMTKVDATELFNHAGKSWLLSFSMYRSGMIFIKDSSELLGE